MQNVGVTLELGLIIVLAFVFRKNRKLHGSLILSTAILFLGIALFFTFISFVPGYIIEGPETFHRFGEAAMAGQGICLVIGLIFLVKDWRHGWPFLMAGAFFLVNEALRSFLQKRDLIDPLTEFVGTLNPAMTFVGSFVVLLGLLAGTGILGTRRRGGRVAVEAG